MVLSRIFGSCVTAFAFLVLSACATFEIESNDEGKVDEQFSLHENCEERAKKQSNILCFKWESDSETAEDYARELTNLLLVLYNTGRLQTKQVDLRQRPSIDSIRQLFSEEVTELSHWDARLDSLICDLNHNVSISWTPYHKCKRPRNRKKQVSPTLEDLKSHVSGLKISTTRDIKWSRRKSSSILDRPKVVLPDIDILRVARSRLVESNDGGSLIEFILNNQLICEGHRISVTPDEIENSQLFSSFSREECVERFIADNSRHKDVDFPQRWNRAALVYAQSAVYFTSRLSIGQNDELHKDLQKILRENPNIFQTSLASLRGEISTYSSDFGGFFANSGESALVSTEALSETPASESFILPRNTQKCISSFFGPNKDHSEKAWSNIQKPLFDELNHPALRTYSHISIELRDRLIDAVKRNRKAYIGIIDTDPTSVQHCENPLLNIQSDYCELLSNRPIRSKNHGLTVSSIAASPINSVSGSSEGFHGMLGLNPCADLMILPVDWDTVAEETIIKNIQNIRSAKPVVWNISATYPRKNFKAKEGFRENLENTIRGNYDQLFVVAAGTIASNNNNSIPLTTRTCELYPGCLSETSKELEAENVLSVVGIVRANQRSTVWKGNDGQDEIVSATSLIFDVAAIAGSGDSKLVGVISTSNDAQISLVEGVSFAVPQVSATASMVQQLYKRASPYSIKKRIIGCSRFYPELKEHVFGGLIDILCSLDGNVDRITHKNNLSKNSPAINYRGMVTGFYRQTDGHYEKIEIEKLFNSYEQIESPPKTLQELMRIQNVSLYSGGPLMVPSIIYVDKGRELRRYLFGPISDKDHVEFLHEVNGTPTLSCFKLRDILEFVPAFDTQDGAATLNKINRDFKLGKHNKSLNFLNSGCK